MLGEIKTVYIPKGNEEAWKVFEEIALREKGSRGFSQLLNEIVVDYAKKHADGNSTFKLEAFQDPNFIGLPTIGEMLKPEVLDKLPKKDFEDLQKAARFRNQEIEASEKRRLHFLRA